MSRVLVTGAGGFIGSSLCDRFMAAGHELLGVDNFTTGREENVPAGEEWWGDITSPGFAASAEKFAPDWIVHCAASYDDRDKWHRDTSTNVQGSINVAIAARASGARVLFLQTALIYGNDPYQERETQIAAMRNGGLAGPFPLPTFARPSPENSYAISKYAGGQYLRHSGVPLLEFRLANIYGPRNLSGPVPAFYKRISEGQPCTVTDTRRDFVYIQDLVELVDQAIAEEATGTYHVSTGRDYPIAQVYDAVVGAMDAYGGPDPTFVDRGPDDAPTILLDPSETLRDFGWRATTDLDEGVEHAVGWYREHGVEHTYTHLAQKG